MKQQTAVELKDLAIAFFNNQKVLYFDDERELNQICRIVELREEEMTISNGEYQYDVEFDDIKIIVKPLSDLTKAFETDTYEQTYIDYIAENFKVEVKGNTIQQEVLLDAKLGHILKHQYSLIEKLLEWNFDVFGLISKGLAVDINTI
jgi:hypothetical protein